jgi:hypothetical protein
VKERSDIHSYSNDPDAFMRLGKHDFFYDAAVYENPMHDWIASVRLSTAIAMKLKRRYLDPNRILSGPPGEGVFNTESEAFRIAVALMLRFNANARSLGAIPVILAIPDIHSLQRMREGIRTISSPLVAVCRESGLICWNLADAFGAEQEDSRIGDWFMPGGHYSPEGNAVAARWIEARLRELPNPRASAQDSHIAKTACSQGV